MLTTWVKTLHQHSFIFMLMILSFTVVAFPLLSLSPILQSAFDIVPSRPLDLKLVLNVTKTKMMLFSNGRKTADSLPDIETLLGSQIEFVPQYKYLDILIDERLTFRPRIENLAKKPKRKLGFYFRNKSCFSDVARKKLVVPPLN